MHWENLEGASGEGGGRGGSGWGTHVNPWLFHFNVWQNLPQIKKKKKAETLFCQQSSVQSKLWLFQWSCMDVKVGVMKNWCFWTVVLEKTLENPLDCKEIQPVHPKGNQSLIFIGRIGAESKIPILWPPDAKSWLTGKDPDAGRDWRQEEKGTTKDEMVGWHHQLNGHEFEQSLGVGGRQGRLACFSP